MSDGVALAERANRDLYRDLTLRSGGLVDERDGLCRIQGIHPSWVIANTAFRTDPALSAAAAIARTDAAFRAVDRRPVLMTFRRPDADLDAGLEEAGWIMAIELPVMVRATPLPSSAFLPSDAAIRWLDADVTADLDALRTVLRRGFAADDEERAVVDSLFARPSAIRPPGVAAVIAEIDGVPVAAALVYRVHGFAVVAWVATIPEARRRGLGRLVTAEATNRGFKLGAESVTLQASPMGGPLYVSMGYEPVTSSRIWIAPKVAPRA